MYLMHDTLLYILESHIITTLSFFNVNFVRKTRGNPDDDFIKKIKRKSEYYVVQVKFYTSRVHNIYTTGIELMYRCSPTTLRLLVM